MASSPDRHARTMLPIPDRPAHGLTTYDAKDPDTKEARLDAVLTGVSREQMQRAGRDLQATREHHLAYRRELFDIPFDDERVTLIIMDEDWQTAHDRIRREERTALPSRLLSRLRRLWR